MAIGGLFESGAGCVDSLLAGALFDEGGVLGDLREDAAGGGDTFLTGAFFYEGELLGGPQ